MATRCQKCGALFLPPRPLCIQCRSQEMKWEQMKGKGKLVAFTCITVGTTLMLRQGFNRNNPYCTGIVELEEGPRISARILGVDVQNPEKIKMGTPLIVDFIDWENEGTKRTFLAFKS